MTEARFGRRDPDRARLLRRIRRQVRARNARRAGRGAAGGVSRGAPGRGVPGGARPACSRITWAARRRCTKRDGCARRWPKPAARIFLKREDLAHTGAHKINNALGQALLAKRMGKRRIVAETGAGQHGVATATASALLGLECHVYMGADDMARQALNVVRMRLLGATVRRRGCRQPDA